MRIPKVYNMDSPRTGNPVANQFIIKVGEVDYFQSYKTIIAKVDNSSYPAKVTLDKGAWNYSVTTSKYRNEFLNTTTKETKEAIKSGRYKLANLNK